MVTEVFYEWLATGRGKPLLGEDWIPAAMGEVVDDPLEIMLLQAYRSCTNGGSVLVLKLLVEKASSTNKSNLHAASHSMLVNSDWDEREHSPECGDSREVGVSPLPSE